MKVGIVGTGVMGQTHLEAWSQAGIPVAACLTRNPGKLQKSFAGHGIQALADWSEFLAAVDIVDICTPTHLHSECVEKAALAGKHIICEKPLALNLQDGRRMLDICRREGVSFFPAHVLRFFPEYRSAADAVAAGRIGTPAVIRLSRESFCPDKTGDNWFLDPARSGGMILDLMLHDFDYARLLAGEVRTVYARSLQPEDAVSGDHALVILEHENGVLTHVQGSWKLPKPHFRTSFEIAGTEGVIRSDSEQANPLRPLLHTSETESKEVALPSGSVEDNPYRTELAAFHQSLNDSSMELPVTAEDAWESLAVALAAVESARTGKMIHLKDFKSAAQEVSE